MQAGSTGGVTDPSWVISQALPVDEAGKALVFYTFQQPQQELQQLLIRPQLQQPPGDYYLKVRREMMEEGAP